MRQIALFFLPTLALLTAAPAAAESRPDCRVFNSAHFFQTATPDDVAHCLGEGAELLPADAPEDQPLFHAVRNATKPAVLDVLLGAAAERDQLKDVLNAPDPVGRTILHVAAAEAHDPAMITWLVAWGADVRAKYDCDGGWRQKCTEPVHLAAGRTDGFLFLATLMALGGDSAVADAQDRTPTDLAAAAGPDGQHMVALLGARDWPEESERHAIVPPDPTARCEAFLTPEFFATATLAQLTHCLDEGAAATATDRDGNTALHHAAAHADDPPMIDLLLHRLHAQGPAAVENALQRTNGARMPPLHHAAQHGRTPETTVRLLAWGADPDALAEPIERRRMRADRGTTALHMAARNAGPAREAILTVLLAAGASPTIQDHSTNATGGRQALHELMLHAPTVQEATLLVTAEVARKKLLDRPGELVWGAVISDDAKATALHLAVAEDADYDVVKRLVRSGFSPDARDRDGVTPLMRAARSTTDEKVFVLLLDESEKPCAASDAGFTIPALLAANDALRHDDPTGRDITPLQAYRDRCP